MLGIFKQKEAGLSAADKMQATKTACFYARQVATHIDKGEALLVIEAYQSLDYWLRQSGSSSLSFAGYTFTIVDNITKIEKA